MGVPAFYRWLVEKYPKVVVDMLEKRMTVINGQIIPLDLSEPNPNGLEYDNLYIDMNGLIHPCSHPEDRETPSSESEMYANITKYVDRLFATVRPRRLLFLAIDGVAPRAKLNQQRSRRFRAARDAKDAKKALEEIIADMKALGQNPPSEASDAWDSNVITPGTEFMAKLSDYIWFYILERMNNNPAWMKIKVIFSDASEPGEGEHKIMQFIRCQRCQEGYDPNQRHILHGLDADLIMLALATHEAHFTILREQVTFGRRDRDKPLISEAQQLLDAQVSEAGGIAVFTTKTEDEWIFSKPLQCLHVNILREYLFNEFICLQNSLVSFPFDMERIIDDFVFLCFFVGNDFIPHLPSLDIRDGAIDFLINVYKEILPSLSDYLTYEGGNVNLSEVDIILARVGEIEDEVFKFRKMAEDEEADKKRRSKEARHRQGHGQGQGSSGYGSRTLSSGQPMNLVRPGDFAQRPFSQSTLPPPPAVNALRGFTLPPPPPPPPMMAVPSLAPASQPTRPPIRRDPRLSLYDNAANQGVVLKGESSSPSVTGGVASSSITREVLSQPADENNQAANRLKAMLQRKSGAVPGQIETVVSTASSSNNTEMEVLGDSSSSSDIPAASITSNTSDASFDVAKKRKPDEMSFDPLHPDTDDQLLGRKCVDQPPKLQRVEGLDDVTATVTSSQLTDSAVLVETTPEEDSSLLDPITGVETTNGDTAQVEMLIGAENPTKDIAADSSEGVRKSEDESVENGEENNEGNDDDNEEEVEEEEEEEEEFLPTVVPSVQTLEAVRKLREEIKRRFKEKQTDALGKTIERSQSESIDRVRLHEEGWKSRYYDDRYKKEDVAQGGGIQNMCQAYIEGLCWVFKYYYDGCPSWSWYYPFHYSPFASDLRNVDLFKISFTKSKPLRPFEQLLAVLPPESAHALPESVRWLMTEESSPIIDLYQEDVPMDPNGKHLPWLWVLLLPFIDEKRVISALELCEKNMNERDKRLNNYGKPVLFVHKNHSLMVSILNKGEGDSLGLIAQYSSASAEIQSLSNDEVPGMDMGEEQNDEEVKDIQLLENGVTADLSESLVPFIPSEGQGISGSLGKISSPLYAIGRKIIAPKEPIGFWSHIKHNLVYPFQYQFPSDGLHRSKILIGAIFDPPKLLPIDLMVRRSPRLNKGFNMLDIAKQHQEERDRNVGKLQNSPSLGLNLGHDMFSSARIMPYAQQQQHQHQSLSSFIPRPTHQSPYQNYNFNPSYPRNNDGYSNGRGSQRQPQSNFSFNATPRGVNNRPYQANRPTYDPRASQSDFRQQPVDPMSRAVRHHLPTNPSPHIRQQGQYPPPRQYSAPSSRSLAFNAPPMGRPPPSFNTGYSNPRPSWARGEPAVNLAHTQSSSLPSMQSMREQLMSTVANIQGGRGSPRPVTGYRSHQNDTRYNPTSYSKPRDPRLR